jgi:GDP-L-fucose synthase
VHKDAKIYIPGHGGLVGSALVRKLQSLGYPNLLTRTHAELELTAQQAVREFFDREQPEYVFLAAAKVGGIWANNTYPAEFIHQNLAIQTNVIHESWRHGVKRLLFLGSSCIYPRDCPQPMKEEYLLTGPLEPTNRPYAIAKIAGIEMCWSYNRQYGTRYLALMPTNLHGPGDNFDLETSHVLAAMIRKFHLGKLAMQGDWHAIAQDDKCWGPIPEDLRRSLAIPDSTSKPLTHSTAQPKVVLWGTGTPMREFLHVDDMADACVFLMNLPDDQFDQALSPQTADHSPSQPFNYSTDRRSSHSTSQPLNQSPPLVNIGAGKDIPIRELADLVAKVVGYEGDVLWDASKPDGSPRKLLNVARLSQQGWIAGMSLLTGVSNTYNWYLAAAEPNGVWPKGYQDIGAS